MPSAPPRVCNRCKGPATKGQPCQCRPAFEGSTHPAGHDDRRMAAAVRDYRRTHPLCEHTGCPRLADHTDHIKPLAEGGDRYSWTNMQALCEPHHQTKTTADALRGKTRRR
jgi:5-methylcytosine-specific restriction protein A